MRKGGKREVGEVKRCSLLFFYIRRCIGFRLLGFYVALHDPAILKRFSFSLVATSVGQNALNGLEK